MSMIAFFPWLYLKEQLQVGEFELIPYKRGQAPGGADIKLQRTLDGVISPYRVEGSHAINKATIVRVNQGNLTRNLSEDERNALFVLSEILSVAGLSRREFFGGALSCYQNRDNFRIIIQSFTEADRGVSITSRRRDGVTINYQSEDSYRVQKPEHIPINSVGQVDEMPLRSLLRARASEDWERFYESILGFNSANTDNGEITERVELVLLSGAMERLFDCPRGQENDLAERFTLALSPNGERTPSSCGRLSTPELASRFKKSSSVREIWVRDLFRLRSNLAHGKGESRYRPVWSLQEHLLLGSFVYPLLLKRELTKAGLYKISDEDQELIDLFEALACEELFPPEPNRGDPNSYPWHQIFQRMTEERSQKWLRAYIDKMWKQNNEE